MSTLQFNLNIPFEINTNELPDLNIEVDHNVDEYSISDLNLYPNEDNDTQLGVRLQESSEELNLNCGK